MTLAVPLKPVPAQTLAVVLGGQNCQINVYQKFTGLFMDIYVNNASIILGVVCQNRNRIVRSAYLGFIGDFIFDDTQGKSDPTFDGLGARYHLVYLTQADLATLGLAA